MKATWKKQYSKGLLKRCTVPVAAVIFLAVLVMPSPAARAITLREDFDATVPLQPETTAAIERAQQWLVARQGKNGAWGNNGVNAMALMALMVDGNTPGKGEHGTAIAKGIDYLIGTQTGNGFMAVGGRGPMYQHALATLALAEAYGMSENPAIRDALTKAVNLIVQVQDYGGGWRYSPHPMRGDMSVTVMQVMALRAAAETGIYVPDETIDHAMKFIDNCWVEQKSGWAYMSNRGDINFNRTAAGVVCLQSLGRFDDPRIPRAVQTMRDQDFGMGKRGHYWYGHYYASVALYHYGGEAWKAYYPRICRKIIGDWQKHGHYRNVLNTSWAVLVMGVPYRYLPIYQR